MTRPTPYQAIRACLTAAVLLAALATAGPVSAQDASDPYGGTTTTSRAVQLQATCDLSVTQGHAGASVTATVFNVAFGGTVRILFGGTEVARATAPLQAQSAAAPVLLGGEVLAPQAATTTLEIPFVVPNMAAGSYLVTAVGVDFTCLCSPETGGNFKVLAAQATQGRSGPLPRTGIYVALFVVVAFALLLFGRALLEASRRRRRRASRAAREAARHLRQTDEDLLRSVTK